VRYQPNLAIVCVGDGPFTMGPQDAARACEWMGVSQAVPERLIQTGRERSGPRRLDRVYSQERDAMIPAHVSSLANSPSAVSIVRVRITRVTSAR
jgi:hypothetical protein